MVSFDLFERGRLGNSSARPGISMKPPAKFTANCQRVQLFMNPAMESSLSFHRRSGTAILLHCDPAPRILKFAGNFQYEIVMGSDCEHYFKRVAHSVMVHTMARNLSHAAARGRDGARGKQKIAVHAHACKPNIWHFWRKS